MQELNLVTCTYFIKVIICFKYKTSKSDKAQNIQYIVNFLHLKNWAKIQHSSKSERAKFGQFWRKKIDDSWIQGRPSEHPIVVISQIFRIFHKMWN